MPEQIKQLSVDMDERMNFLSEGIDRVAHIAAARAASSDQADDVNDDRGA